MKIFESRLLRRIGHLTFWLFIIVFMLTTTNTPSFTFVHNLVDVIVDTSLLMVPFYFNVYYLIPKYYNKNEKLKYLFSIILLIPIGSAYYFLSVRASYHFIFKEDFWPTNRLILNQNINLCVWNVILSICMSSFAKISYDHFYLNNYVEKVENEKNKYELAFLKAQINPHFLFNIINSIYFHIDETNIKAKDLLEKLSDLLRYTLYDSDKENITVQDEINFIKNYYDLQKIRIDNNCDFHLRVDVKGEKLIKPYIIMPLLENAFKHFSFKNNNGFIEISIIEINSKKLSITIRNSFQSVDKQSSKLNGVGIINLKERLTMFYKNNYDLTFNKDIEHSIFEVKLELPYES